MFIVAYLVSLILRIGICLGTMNATFDPDLMSNDLKAEYASCVRMKLMHRNSSYAGPEDILFSFSA